jgi:hypothetical protein
MCADGAPLVATLARALLALLFRFAPQELLSLAAAALRPLVAADPGGFGALVATLVPADSPPGLRADAATGAAQLQAAALQPRLPAFSLALEEFVAATRGALVMH